MKRKHKLMMAAIGAGLCGGILAACSTRENAAQNSEPAAIMPPNAASDETETQSTELVALADDEEQAQEIAALYQIELLSFSDGVAVYTTDQEPGELIALGKQNGYPLLTVNHTLQLY